MAKPVTVTSASARVLYVEAPSASLTTTKQTLKCRAILDDDFSADFIRRSRMVRVRFKISAIALGAEDLVWNLATDEDGDFAITPAVIQEIVPGQTDATNGGVTGLIAAEYVIPLDEFDGSIYIVAAIDTAGTATLDKATVEFVP